jgi:hypothetical protein
LRETSAAAVGTPAAADPIVKVEDIVQQYLSESLAAAMPFAAINFMGIG